MTSPSSQRLIDTDIEAYLKQHEQKELLRFLTCGSVDDGKSTLIGRLLYDSKMIYEDQLAALRKDSRQHGTTGDDFDPALLTDGLKAEREQGITIDVAYRYFSTDKRKFIIADTPGHEQYTRNMATGASTCDLAVILIDARRGVVVQTRRHSFIVSLLGIRHVLVAVNKMDLVDYRQEVFDQIRADYQAFAARLDIPDLHFIPISALKGDNVVDPSPRMPWYEGPTFLRFLETVYIGSDRNLQDFRFPVQWVNRPNPDFRGYSGTIASGIIRAGEEVLILPSRRRTRVARIVTADGDLDEAFTPQAVTLTLADDVDVSRGDMIVRPGNVPEVADHFEAMVVWMHEDRLLPGKTYWFKHSSRVLPGKVDRVRYRVDVNTLRRMPAPGLELNEVGRVAVSLAAPIAFDDYRRNRSTGAFILIDRITHATVGAGMILTQRTDEDRRARWDETRHLETLEEAPSRIEPAERQARFGQRPATILLTGLTGTGKTTIAQALERRLFDDGYAVAVLDGQQLRRGISRDLGFSADERSENLRRGAEIARLLNETGLICIAAMVAPSREARARAREVIGPDRFVEVHLTAPEDVRRTRDASGHYAMADTGEIPDFPGVSAPYEAPENPDLTIDTSRKGIAEAVDALVQLLQQRGFLQG